LEKFSPLLIQKAIFRQLLKTFLQQTDIINSLTFALIFKICKKRLFYEYGRFV